ncbi:hypothetical protein LZ32DRAFT_173680 [Colletotrichum eremochloae]|nr:hypothetical protein LZ32DRAFT_173680 [Colletotrichum eremochloae]
MLIIDARKSFCAAYLLFFQPTVEGYRVPADLPTRFGGKPPAGRREGDTRLPGRGRTRDQSQKLGKHVSNFFGVRHHMHGLDRRDEQVGTCNLTCAGSCLLLVGVLATYWHLTTTTPSRDINGSSSRYSVPQAAGKSRTLPPIGSSFSSFYVTPSSLH